MSVIKNYAIYRDFLEKSYQNETTIVFYKIPQENKFYFLYSELPIIKKRVSEFNFEKEKGFVFSQFGSDDVFFIQPNILFDGSKKKVLQKLKNQFSKSFCFSVQNNFKKENDRKSDKESEKKKYIQLVKNAIDEINKKKLNKIVVATQKKKKKKISLLDSFFNACNLYPDAFVSLLVISGKDTWLGASPEILLKKQNSKTLLSHSLAATQKKNNKSKCYWSTKEIEEQALVSRYLIDCFKDIRFREFDIFGPETIGTGNLFHLQSKVIINYQELKKQNKSYGDLISLLHPTSAICGMPKKKAMKWIIKNESRSRKLYCGFLGPVNINKHLMQFVNIRCFEKIGDELILYTGAGITAKSNPLHEWLETQNKISNIERIMVS